MAVQPFRQVPSIAGGQGDLSVDACRLAASIALRDLSHADQRVASAPQHQLLQIADLFEVPFLRRLEDPLPQSPYVVLVGAPVDGVPVGGRVLRSVHSEGRHRESECVCRHLCPTCPSVPVLQLWCIKGSPGPRQLPFGPGRCLYPAGYAGRPRRVRPWCPGFPSPFGVPALASWTVLLPPGSWASLTVGLPGQVPDPDGVFTFRMVEIRPGWALSVPRGGGVLRGWLLVTSRRLPFRNGQPCPQRFIPSPGVSMSRHHREFACTRPSGLPLACSPRMEREPLGVFPELRTLPLPATHVRAGTDL